MVQGPRAFCRERPGECCFGSWQIVSWAGGQWPWASSWLALRPRAAGPVRGLALPLGCCPSTFSASGFEEVWTCPGHSSGAGLFTGLAGRKSGGTHKAPGRGEAWLTRRGAARCTWRGCHGGFSQVPGLPVCTRRTRRSEVGTGNLFF